MSSLGSLFDDMARRGIKDIRIFWVVALFPLLGPLIYLCLRPSLPESFYLKERDTTVNSPLWQ